MIGTQVNALQLTRIPLDDKQRYDLIVIGAGPAGLSAARMAARLGLRTLLLEKLPQAGDLGYPCGAAIAPHPGFVSGQRRDDGLHFPELDLLIPHSLIVGWPTTQRYISFAYMIVYEVRHRWRPYQARWWLQAEIAE